MPSSPAVGETCSVSGEMCQDMKSTKFSAPDRDSGENVERRQPVSDVCAESPADCDINHQQINKNMETADCTSDSPPLSLESLMSRDDILSRDSMRSRDSQEQSTTSQSQCDEAEPKTSVNQATKDNLHTVTPGGEIVEDNLRIATPGDSNLNDKLQIAIPGLETVEKKLHTVTPGGEIVEDTLHTVTPGGDTVDDTLQRSSGNRRRGRKRKSVDPLENTGSRKSSRLSSRNR